MFLNVRLAEERDIEEGISEDLKTKRIVLDILNSLSNDIRFTAEISEEFADGKIPTLDFAMWVEKVVSEEGEHQINPFFNCTNIHIDCQDCKPNQQEDL